MNSGNHNEHTLEEEIDLWADNPMGFMFFKTLHMSLEENGGCSNCISVAKRIKN